MLSDFFNKNFARAMKFKVTAAARRFMAHNRRVFAAQWLQARPRRLVGTKHDGMGHISYSYLANALAELHGARIEAYLPSVQAGLNAKILFGGQHLGLEYFGIYRSFGTAGSLRWAPMQRSWSVPVRSVRKSGRAFATCAISRS